MAKVEAAEANLAQAAVGLCVVDRVILRLDVGGPVEVYLGLVIYVADPVKVADSMIVCLGTAVPRTFPPTWAPFLDTRTTRKFGGPQSLGARDTFITSSAIRSVITSVSLSVSFVVVSVIRVPMCPRVSTRMQLHMCPGSPPHTRYREG